MKINITILAFLLCSFCLSFINQTLPVHITGHVKSNINYSSKYVNGVLVFVKGDNSVLAKTYTDSIGNFELTFTPKTERSFDFYCNSLEVDTLLIGSFKKFESDTPELYFYIPNKIKKNNLGQVICLKCKKADMVYKIIFSDGFPDKFDDDKENYSPNPNRNIIDGKYYAGSCIAGFANYYCDRDKVKF